MKHFQHLIKLSLLLVTLAVMGTFLGSLGAQDVPPRIIETNPFSGEELLLDQDLTLYFDQAMNRESVEAALALSEGDIGALTWQDDLTLTVSPETEWKRASEFTLTLGEDAQSAAGTPVAEAIALDFRVVGFLEATTFLPTGENIATDNVITVIFNRPVVPLVSVEEQADLPTPIIISPEIAGSGEWLNTSIYVFTPETALQGGTQYEVTVPAGLTDVTGAIFEEDFSWTFTTEDPLIVEVIPVAGATPRPLDQAVTVEFSQAMDRETTEAAFTLRSGVNSVRVGGEFEWADDDLSFVFNPSGNLAIETPYDIIIDAQIAQSATGASLMGGWESRFDTVPYPRISSTTPSDGNTAANPYGGFEIYFNTEIDEDTLADKVIITPEPWREFDSYYYDYSNRYSLFFDTEPSTDYTIEILPGIEDVYGNGLADTQGGASLVINFTTAPYDPEINFNSPSFVGMYSAYNANTRLFATHRNVSRLDLNLYDLDLPTLSKFLGPSAYDFRQQWVPLPETRLRNWSIDVQSQPNARRYELLLLSESGGDGIQNIECLGAPPPQMRVGDIGIVSTEDPRPLRVRSLPNLQGEILTEVFPETEFTVVDGPICADGFIWWNISIGESGITGWSAEGTVENTFIEMTQRQGLETEALDPEDFPALDPGVYYLSMRAPETAALGYDTSEHIALVATANITLKISPDTALAWVTDLQTGLPVPDAEVQFYDNSFGMLGRLQTDENGLARLNIPRLRSLYTTLYAVVQGDQTFGFGTTGWDDGLSPWQFGVPGDYEPSRLSTYLYTDRPIYRPGQPVYFRGVMRNRDDMQFSLPTDRSTVPVQIFDPEDQIVFEGDVALTQYGTFSSDFTLDEGAALGFYRVVVDLTNDQSYQNYFSVGFNVAEYVPPEFLVSTTPAVDEVVQGETIDVVVESTFFFGGPVSDAKVEWTVLSANYFFDYAGQGRFDFVDFNYDEGPGEYYGSFGERIADGEATTDAEGKFLISIPADLGTKAQSQEFTIEARVFDESDRWVAGRGTVIVHQGEVYVGLSPEEYVGRAGEETGVQIVSVDWESEPVAEQEIDYRIVRRVWSNVQEEDELGRTVYTWEVEEIDVEDAAGTVTSDAEGRARISYVPPEAGTYKIYATSRDALGNEIRASSFMWVSGSQYVSWRQQNSNRFDLITNADEYSVDDTAEILIASPFQGEVQALITVERGNILSQEVITLESNSQVYELPILDDYAPNVFVSVTLVKGVDEFNAYAEFRSALTKLTVNPERRRLNIEITPELDMDAGEFAGPGDEVSFTIRTTDWQGNPVPAEVGIGVTDLAVLSIAEDNSQPIFDYFYAERGVSVRTATPLTILVDKTTQTIIDTIKGGGGGGAESGIFDIREEFVDTPGWEPTLVTDENGLATYTLTLPDNLTTWRLDARGVTRSADGEPLLVGQNTADLLSTKPLLVRPLTPRFMVVDDEIEIGTIVNNNTGGRQTVDVSIEGTGFTLIDMEGNALLQTVEIAAGQRQRVNWRIRALDVEAVDLTFFASGNDGQFTDASKPPSGRIGDRMIPVYRYEVRETVGTAGLLREEDSRTELVAFPRRFEANQGQLTVELDRSLAGVTVDGLDYLRNFPHQCTEQTVSKFLPNIMTLRALTQLGVNNPDLKTQLDEQVNFAIQRLYSTQHTNGGWGWFPQSATNPLVTTYALMGLAAARNNGYVIDNNVIDRAAAYVQQEIDGFEVQSAVWRSNRQAFYIYGLTQAGYFQNSAASVLYNQRTRLNTDASAYLAMAMYSMNPTDERLNAFRADFISTAILSATGAHWEDNPDALNWTTETRTTALVLAAMIRIDPDNDLLASVVRWLMVARNGDAWETTQETAWAVMALSDWMVVTNELNPSYTFGLGLNGSQQTLADDTATSQNATESERLVFEVNELLTDAANRLTFVRSEGEGNLYYTAHLDVYLPVPQVEALSQGIILERRYFAQDDENYENPLTEGRVGETVEVVLTIIAPNDLNFVVIEDPLPAGASAIDTTLLTASALDDGPRLDGPLSRGWGWWWFSRSELRDEKVVMYADFLPQGTYEYRYSIQLGLQGTFNVIPPTGQEFYFPEVYGRGEGSTFTILPADSQ